MTYVLLPVGNYYNTRYENIIAGVMHITAGATDYTAPDTSAEGTLNWFKQKASQVSIHGIVDSDTEQDCLPDEYTAWHAKGYNSCTIGLEIGTGQVDWRKAPDNWVTATIRNAARWWAPRIIKWGIPLVKVTKAQVDNERAKGKAAKPIGFIGHGDLDPRNRTDPGLVRGTDTFPWALFFQCAAEEVAKLQPPAEKPTQQPGAVGTPAKPKPIPQAAWSVKYGDTGARVRQVQQALNTWCENHGWRTRVTVDGQYGPGTRALVIKFQQGSKLAPDGEFGPASQAAMTKAAGVKW